jgi:hypothetical protein
MRKRVGRANNIQKRKKETSVFFSYQFSYSRRFRVVPSDRLFVSRRGTSFRRKHANVFDHLH